MGILWFDQINLSPEIDTESVGQDIDQYSLVKELSEDETNSLLSDRMGIKNFEFYENQIFVDPRVYEKLEQEKEIDVVVYLKNKFNSFDVEDIKNKVSLQQDSFFDQTSDLINEKDLKIKDKYEITNGFSAKINSESLDYLLKREDISEIHLDEVVELSLAESNSLIRSDVVRTYRSIFGGNISGSGQTVCILDTGVNYLHPSLGGCFGPGCKVVGGYDFINNDPDPLETSSGWAYDWHGTHVSGIVSSSSGIIGVAPGSNIVALKVCDQSTNGCPTSAIAAGLDYCLARIQTLGIDAITISIGTGEHNSNQCPSALRNQIDMATYLNVPVTISSGNDGHRAGISWPACIENAISVGSSKDYGDLAISNFSNTAQNLDLIAPGEIISSTYGQSFLTLAGTSMAAPHVAGVIALMKEIDYKITPKQLLNLFKITGDRLIDSNNSLIFSRINALNALNFFTYLGGEKRITNNLSISQKPSITKDNSGNLHIVWADNRDGNFELYYRAISNSGHVIYNETRLTYTQYPSTDPSIDILFDGIHVTWTEHYGNSFSTQRDIHYGKISFFNGISFSNERVTYYAFSPSSGWSAYNPKIIVDSLDRANIVWDARSYNVSNRIYFSQKQNTGNFGPIIQVSNSNGITSRRPSMDVDSENNLHIVWNDYRNSPNQEIYYKKISGNTPHQTIINDTRISNGNMPPELSESGLIISDVVVDQNRNVHIVWEDTRNIIASVRIKQIYYSKIDPNGNTIVDDTRLTNTVRNAKSPSLKYFMLPTSSFSNPLVEKIYVAWQDFRDNGSGEIYHKVLDINGAILEQDSRLTSDLGFSGSPAFEKNNWPSISSREIVGLVWEDQKDGNREIYYKDVSGQANPRSIVSNLYYYGSQNNRNVNFYYQDKLNPGESYILALSFGDIPGINVGGHYIPLNRDGLFAASLTNPSLLGLSNSFGTLSSEGKANINLQVPSIVPSGTTVIAAVVVVDSQGYISGISNSVAITIG